MKRILKSRAGVTLIELIAGFAILTIILISVFAAFSFSQKVTVQSDTKNNEAATGQEKVDELITMLSNNQITGAALSNIDINEPGEAVPEAEKFHNKTNNAGFDENEATTQPRQYWIDETSDGYKIYYRAYYDNGTSQINLFGYVRKGDRL